MNKDELLTLLGANGTLQENIAEIIGTSITDEPIYNELDTPWTTDTNLLIYYDVGRNGKLYEYGPTKISSLGDKGEELFCGKEDDVFYAMGYPEDSGWDDSCVLIFDMKNYKEFDENEV